MNRVIKPVGGGVISQGSITSFYTNNTGAPEMIYGIVSQRNGATSIMELSNSATLIDQTNRIYQFQVGDGNALAIPVIVVPPGEQYTGQAAAASADANIQLFAIEEDSAIRRIFLDELPTANTVITTGIVNNGTRVLLNFSTDNGGASREIGVFINGTETIQFDSDINDTNSFEIFLGQADTLSIESNGAGVTCSIYEIPSDIDYKLNVQELV